VKYVVLRHKETLRFLTKPGLCRGWSNWIGNAQFFPDEEAALAFAGPDLKGQVQSLYLYVFDGPIDEPEITPHLQP
jgi:hypothetical protein